MAINLDSPEEIRKRAAANRARTARPTLRKPATRGKFTSRGTTSTTGGAPRTPADAARATKAPPAATTLRGKAGAAASKGKGILRKGLGVAKTGLKVGLPIAGVALAAGEAARTEPLRSPEQKERRGGSGVSFLRTAGESATAGGSEQFAGIAKDDARAFAETVGNVRRAEGVIPTAVEIAKGAVGGTARLASMPQRALLRGIQGVPTGQEPDLATAPAGVAPTPASADPRLRQPRGVSPTADIFQGSVIPGRSVAEQAGVDRNVAGIESQTGSVRSLRAAQLGIPEEALPYIDAGGRVTEVRKALRENLGTNLDTSTSKIDPYKQAQLGLQTKDLERKTLRDATLGGAATRTAEAAAIKGGIQGHEAARADLTARNTRDGEIDTDTVNRQLAVVEGLAPGSPEYNQALLADDVLEGVVPIATAASGFIANGLFNFLDPAEQQKVSSLSREDQQNAVRELITEGKYQGQQIDERDLADTSFFGKSVNPRQRRILELLRAQYAAEQR